MNKTKYTLNILIFNRQPQKMHKLFWNLKIGYDTAQLVHMYAKFHIAFIEEKNLLQNQMRNYIHILNFVEVAYKIFSN